ncbi:hypothetical protein [Leisingera thetidis]|uniref:hypothetical protein n=1 Tax=Leisingera thetidis TaxID=2930199 RepID=UPI0021F7DFF0|nr:hypothetical protein [Leisingera thetidis]
MNSKKCTAVISWSFQAALLLSPVMAAAAAAPGAAVVKGGFQGYVQKAQVRGEPSATAGGTGGGGAADSGTAGSTGPAGPASVSASVTSSVVSQLSISAAACQAVGAAYRTDCLAKELQALAKKLPARGEYAAAREALAKASADLNSLSSQNRDNSQPRLRITVQADSETTRRPVAAVKQETAAETNAKALAILEETTTVLLRSSAGNSDVALHYQRIAQALNSSKVLLRSS